MIILNFDFIKKLIQISKFEKYSRRTMNKLELIDTMKNECRISKKEAATIVDLFFDKISTALAGG
jgi:hypothetical protein